MNARPMRARRCENRVSVAQMCYSFWNCIARLIMSTTTIRIPEDLKARVVDAAERAGTTAHNFMLEAISEKADQAERLADFQNVAEARFATLAASGKTIPWEKMRDYLEDRSAMKPTKRPRAKKLTRVE